MKSSFALQFTDSGITLLHRTGRGWLPLGDAALDDGGMADNMGYLRATALGLEPQGITTKLVIPNGQILYTTVDAPAPEPGKRRNQIRRALEGRTPYPVEDLVFDWSGSGAQVMVAVVARKTLAEAEAFAMEHRFNPMAFVAQPEAGTFDGEPFFGPSAHAETSLAPGEKVERDRAAMRIIGRVDGARQGGPKTAAPVVAQVALPEISEPTPVVVAQPELPLAEVPQVAAEPLAEPLPKPVASVAVMTEPAEPDLEPGPEPKFEPARAAPAEPAPAAIAATLAAMDPVVASLIAGAEAERDRAGPVGSLSGWMAEPDLEPVDPVDPSPLPMATTEAVPEAPAMFDVPMDDSDLPPIPHSVAAFASRRNGAVTAAAVAGGDVRQPSVGPALKPASVTAPVLPGAEAERSEAPQPPRATGKAGTGKVSDPRAKLSATARNGAQPGSMARYVPMKGKGNAAARSGEAASAADKADAAGFTKRNLGKRPEVRGKPKYLGLTLTLLLVLVLAAIAIWSNYFLGNGTGDPAAEISSPVPIDSADAGADPALADSALPSTDTTQSDVLVEPPEADPAADATEGTDAVVTGSAATDAATGTAPAENTSPETAEALQADAVQADPAQAEAVQAEALQADPAQADGAQAGSAVLPDATLSTSDQSAQADTVAAETVDPGSAPIDMAGGAPTPDATDAVVPPVAEPETGAAATAQAETASAADPTTEVATATSNGTETDTASASATNTAAASAQEPEPTPTAEPRPEPVPEPPAAAPEAETSATATLSGQVLDQGDTLPELLASDSGLQTSGPAQLREPVALAGDNKPDTPLPPAPFGTFFDRDANGWVIATPEGTVTPEGALVIAGRPDLVPPKRPDPVAATPDATETATADPPAPEAGSALVRSDPALAKARPRPRPPAPASTQDDTELQIEPQIATASTARPRLRPDTAPAQALTDTGQGFASATEQAIAVSSRPAQRPIDIAASVAAALASVEPQAPAPATEPQPEPEQLVAAVAPLPRPVVPASQPEPQAAAPEADNEPEVASAMPSIPQNASVARQATLANAINLGKVNLIGVYGTPSDRHALVRLATGRYVRVKVGDRVDGGQVAAISEQELRYIKNGRNLVLALPKDS